MSPGACSLFGIQQPTRNADGEVVVVKRTGFRDREAEACAERMKEMRKAFPGLRVHPLAGF